MDDNRYEEMPEKKSAGKVLGNYFKSVFGGFLDSFKYNNMKLASLLVAIPGLVIGFFLVAHASTLNQIDFTFEFYNEQYFSFDKYTLPQIPFDASAISVFLIMLFGILNVFNALSMSNKKNLGSVVISTVFTGIMVVLSAYYVYAVLLYKNFAFETVADAAAAGETAGIYVETAKSTLGTVDTIGEYIHKINGSLGDFTANYLTSIVSIIVCDVLSIIGVVLGFINYDRTYEKVDR